MLSLGYNLIRQTDGSSGWTPHDLIGTSDAPFDPQLGPLRDNGGPTSTEALRVGSPALGKGDPSLAGSYDQRGTSRNFFTIPDIGAFQTSETIRYRVLAPDTVVLGEPFEVTVIALDPFGNRSSIFTGAIHFSSSDPAAMLPDDYTFAADDLGAHTFTITLNTAGSQSVQVNNVVIPFFSGSATVDVESSDGGGTAPGSDLLALVYALVQTQRHGVNGLPYC